VHHFAVMFAWQKGYWHRKALPEVLFCSKWKKKTKEEPADPSLRGKWPAIKMEMMISCGATWTMGYCYSGFDALSHSTGVIHIPHLHAVKLWCINCLKVGSWFVSDVCSRSSDLWDTYLMTGQYWAVCAVFQPRRVCFKEWQSSAYFCRSDVSPRKHCLMYVRFSVLEQFWAVLYMTVVHSDMLTHVSSQVLVWCSFLCVCLGLVFCMFLF